jgi:uncharacterized protein
MIVVIDTSVWVSALQFGSRHTAPVRAVELAMRVDTLATAPQLDTEIRRILQQKFQWSIEDAERLVGAYFKSAIRVELASTLHVCRAPNDDMVLECALLAGAQAIVAGDKDLLVLESFRGIRIVTPTAYLALSR